MNEQLSNGEPKSFLERYDWKRFLASFLEPKRLVIIYISIFVVLSLYLFPPMQKLEEIQYREGDIADVDVIAPFTFYVPYSEQEIEINKSKAALNVPPVYRENDQATKHLPDDLENFMEMIGDVARRDTLSEEERVRLIVDMAPRLGGESARLLLSGTLRKKILEEALRLQAQMLALGQRCPTQGRLQTAAPVAPLAAGQRRMAPPEPVGRPVACNRARAFGWGQLWQSGFDQEYIFFYNNTQDGVL